MKAERDIERKIKQKEDEIQQLREQLFRAEAYLEALQESLKLIKRNADSDSYEGVRPGSLVDKARRILLHAGKPLYVGDILKGMGKEVTKKTRASLSGSLGSYVRQGFIFTRPAPNTFGLIDFHEDTEENSAENFDTDILPEGFGVE